MADIKQSRILIMASDGFEQSELLVPLQKLKEAGATVHVATPGQEADQGLEQEGLGRDRAVGPGDLRRLGRPTTTRWSCPGGQINPDVLRLNETAVGLVREFASSGKVVAAICHAPWLLVEAGLAAGREMTSYQSIKTDVKNAGATWVDKEVVVDDGIITSRAPDDLPAFVAKIIEEVSEGRHQRR